jgi:hypothetical protein
MAYSFRVPFSLPQDQRIDASPISNLWDCQTQTETVLLAGSENSSSSQSGRLAGNWQRALETKPTWASRRRNSSPARMTCEVVCHTVQSPQGWCNRSARHRRPCTGSFGILFLNSRYRNDWHLGRGSPIAINSASLDPGPHPSNRKPRSCSFTFPTRITIGRIDPLAVPRMPHTVTFPERSVTWSYTCEWRMKASVLRTMTRGQQCFCYL